MPSYRSILTVSMLKAGHDPGDVESAARDAVRRTTVLEAFQVDVVRGEPRVTVRFTGSDDAEARGVHARVVEAIGSHAELYAAGGTYRRFWDDQEAIARWRLVGPPAKNEEAPEASGRA